MINDSFRTLWYPSVLVALLGGCIPDFGRPYIWDTAVEDVETDHEEDTNTTDTDTDIDTDISIDTDAIADTDVDTEDVLDPVLVNEGMIVFFTIGGEGCAKCHGADAKGSGGCPNIIGKSRATIVNALATVDPMQILPDLTERQIDAVAEYLAWLAIE